jgi:hypothetical protein
MEGGMMERCTRCGVTYDEKIMYRDGLVLFCQDCFDDMYNIKDRWSTKSKCLHGHPTEKEPFLCCKYCGERLAVTQYYTVEERYMKNETQFPRPEDYGTWMIPQIAAVDNGKIDKVSRYPIAICNGCLGNQDRTPERSTSVNVEVEKPHPVSAINQCADFCTVSTQYGTAETITGCILSSRNISLRKNGVEFAQAINIGHCMDIIRDVYGAVVCWNNIQWKAAA